MHELDDILKDVLTKYPEFSGYKIITKYKKMRKGTAFVEGFGDNCVLAEDALKCDYRIVFNENMMETEPSVKRGLIAWYLSSMLVYHKESLSDGFLRRFSKKRQQDYYEKVRSTAEERGFDQDLQAVYNFQRSR